MREVEDWWVRGEELRLEEEEEGEEEGDPISSSGRRLRMVGVFRIADLTGGLLRNDAAAAEGVRLLPLGVETSEGFMSVWVVPEGRAGLSFREETVVSEEEDEAGDEEGEDEELCELLTRVCRRRSMEAGLFAGVFESAETEEGEGEEVAERSFCWLAFSSWN